jgi:mannose-6-phosphate isomerase-like protein (cupin superfamily)
MSERMILAVLLAAAGCGHGQGVSAPASAPASEPAPAQPAMLDALFEQGRLTRPLGELMASAALSEGEDFKIVELGRDAHSSHHLVSLRDRELVHRHDLHDLLVFVAQGQGHMLIGTEQRAIGVHSIVYVPRGTPHAMRNASAAPIVGYAVFTPAFDGQDRVPVEPAEAGEAAR